MLLGYGVWRFVIKQFLALSTQFHSGLRNPHSGQAPATWPPIMLSFLIEIPHQISHLAALVDYMPFI